MKTKFSKVIAAILVVMLLVSSLPVLAVSASSTTSFSNSQLSVVTDKTSTLAPGVTQDAYTVYDKNGDQVKMFVTKADMSTDTVKVFASYKDMDPTNYGMSKLTEQVAAFDKKAAAGDEYYQGTVVAGINASYYNMTTGKPTGTFVMNGTDVTTESEGNAYGYFAVMKDGTVKIGNKGDYSNDKGNIQEAIGIYQMLVVDGKICSGLNATTKYPRQTIGITADGDVILMTADGNQAPATVGLTIQEQAEVMLDLGCVWAGHLDGGGSCTYASKPEGSDNFVITNSPSDGSERSVSNGFIIVSTAATSYEFDKVLFNAENEYLTPGSQVNVSVSGVSSTGNAAEIPAELTYEVTNGTYVDGVFTAGNEIGEAVISAVYNGETVSSCTLNVVVPQAISFDNSVITVPFGKTVSLDVTATYGLNEVAINENDVVYTLSDAALGTVNGFLFTAGAENASISSGNVVVTLAANSAISASASIILGKGSEVIQGFEDGSVPESYTIKTGYPQYGPMGGKTDANGNYYYNGQNELGYLEVVTAENGQVHDGTYSMAVECDFSQAYETGYHQLSLKGLNLTVPANAQTIGMWIYLPELEELMTTSMRFVGTRTDTQATVSSPWLWDNCEPYGWENDGWRWISMDISGYDSEIVFNTIQIYICDRDNSDVNFYFKDHASVNGKFTYYMDSITLDYSSAVDDREPPVFTDVRYADTSMSDTVTLDGQTVANSLVSFTAFVEEDTAKTNFTGINSSGIKAFIDGVAVDFSYDSGKISIVDKALADGVHTIRFEASDNMGNMSYVERQITVAADSDIPTLSIVPENADADGLLIGALYWVDLVADSAKDVESATVTFNLNSMSQWELENMVTTYGFESDYVIDEVNNNATITVNKVGKVADDATVLVKIPVRTWESRLTEYEGYEAQTPEKLWSRKIIWPIDIKLSADYGAVTFTDGTTGSFSMAPVEVITELYGNYGELNANGDYSNKTSWHIHTAEAIEDKAATCTEAGYTGRTYCEVCESVVEWGTTAPAKGHTYKITDNVLKCACGDLFSGVFTDGKTYADGVALAGWNNDCYFVDGVALKGVQEVEGYYYDFGDDGVCVGQVKFTGLFYDATAEAYRYSKLGELAGGWIMIGEDWHYFKAVSKVAATGEYTIDGVTFNFDETGMTKGAWNTTEAGTRYYYGPTYYYAREAGYMTLVEIDGKTYNFDVDGYTTPGTWALRDSTSFKKQVYVIGDDGAVIERITEQGTVTCSDGVYYINEEGVVPMNACLVKCGEDYYYVVPSGKVVISAERVIDETQANGLLPAGTYTFGADGKLVTPFTGIGEDGYYYEDSVVKGNLGLIELDGNYYFVCYSGKIKKDSNQTITEATANGLVEPGVYYFDAEGKMIIPETPEKPFTGIGEDGYYYVDGAIKGNAGLIEIDGDYYFVCYSGKIKKGSNQTVTETTANGLVTPGTYYFDADGKMDVPEAPFTGIGEDGYYYVDGTIKGNAGLVEIDGNYYFVCYSGKIKKGSNQTITEATANGLVEPGLYYFDADGKMDVPEAPFTGIGEDGYYYVDGAVKGNAGLIELDGDYYFVCYSGKIKKGSNQTVTEATANGLVTPGLYYFGADGKMVK